ncbi:hypothetical protein [Providencia sp. PROV266]|uniref:hypothetical protein n=1 Tax=Providencia sp. PROV266 TaxID=2949954 RepID=UPI00234B7D51|nr:hypothetical protein [Providencia sp. PROV266]
MSIHFKKVIYSLCNQFKLHDNDGMPYTSIIEENESGLLVKPTKNNSYQSYVLLSILTESILNLAEHLYGVCETYYSTCPDIGSDYALEEYRNYFLQQGKSLDDVRSIQLNRSFISMTKKGSYAVFVSNAATNWESVFYELCHECIHLLSPATGDLKNEVQRLDEGVAVKFAEAQYRKYITPYTYSHPTYSPLTSQPNGQYSTSYKYANKIPDEKLKEVRLAFGSFWSVTDKDKFMSIVGNYITEEEADYLLSKFDYNIP